MIAPNVRATIAAVILAHAKGELVTSLHDHAQNERLDIRANFKGDEVDAYDSGRTARISGTLPDLYDHALRKYIHLTKEADRYVGYDHFSGTHFHAIVRGDTVAIYDYGITQWSQYSA